MKKVVFRTRFVALFDIPLQCLCLDEFEPIFFYKKTHVFEEIYSLFISQKLAKSARFGEFFIEKCWNLKRCLRLEMLEKTPLFGSRKK